MSIKTIKRFLRNFIPAFLLKRYYKCKASKTERYKLWQEQQEIYKAEVERLSQLEGPINVVFLVLYASVWKYDSLYRLMAKDKRFNPCILVCPIADRGYEHMVENLLPTYEMFKQKGYNVRCAYDSKTDKYIDVPDLKPDIIFFAYQYANHVDARYNEYTLKPYLKCYVNYSFKNNPYVWSIASQFHGLMWQYYSECEDNKRFVQSVSTWEFNNIHVVGYPMYDEFVQIKATGKDWKIQDNHARKRIIWAPHHTIEGNDAAIKLSTFLLNADFMLTLAERYKDRIQFAFKPHPQLRPALYQHPDWGKERTDAYYAKWEKGENTTFISGEYVDLFKSSDAMIHDCHSFIVEYLYTQKPVLYLANFDRESQCNEVGKKAFACHYHGTTQDDVINFIENIVLAEQDTMTDIRKNFYKAILVPPHGLSVAENIVNEIMAAIGR